MGNKILILSTFTKDKLIDEAGSIIRTQNGGPAFYLAHTFKKEGVPISIKTGPRMEVQILMTKGGELGKVPRRPKPKSVKFTAVKTPFLIISSVLDEFDISNLYTFNGKIFLDVQGYVRNGKDFGKKKPWKPRKEVFENIFCLKGTKEEIKHVSAQLIKRQKRKILLITNGKRGCEVFAYGKRYLVRPQKVVSTNNTIGAGDSFFAYFVAQFIKTGNILYSVKYATKETSSFLQSTRGG